MEEGSDARRGRPQRGRRRRLYLPIEDEDERHIVSLIQEVGRTAVAHPGELKDREYGRSLVNASVERLKALAQQLGPRGIRVSVVDLRELAPAYVFLPSAESGFVMTETLCVNGGQPTP